MTFDRRTATCCQQPEHAGFCELPAPASEMKSRPKRICLNFNELISHPESNRQHAEQVSEGHDDLRNEPRPARLNVMRTIHQKPPGKKAAPCGAALLVRNIRYRSVIDGVFDGIGRRLHILANTPDCVGAGGQCQSADNDGYRRKT
jgi:hypothetical protein